MDADSNVSPHTPPPYPCGSNALPELKHGESRNFGTYSGRSKDPVFTWVHFEILSPTAPTSAQTRAKFRCKLCKTIGAVGRGPSNVKSHFLVHHFTALVTIPYEGAKKEHSPDKLRLQKGIASFNVSKVHRSGVQQKRLVKLCAEWIARDCRPLNTVQDIGFREIVREVAPRYHPVSRRSVVRYLSQAEEKVELCMRNISRQSLLSRLQRMFGQLRIVSHTHHSPLPLLTKTGSFSDYCLFQVERAPVAPLAKSFPSSWSGLLETLGSSKKLRLLQRMGQPKRNVK